MDLEKILFEIKNIQSTANFNVNRDDARKAYNLLKSDFDLEFEQSIFEEKFFQIKHSILIEDKNQAFRLFAKALVSIIEIIERSLKI